MARNTKADWARGADGRPLPSEDLCRVVAERSGGRAALAFSAGKDSVAAWLQMRRHFDEITPVFFYLVPDLEFIEAGLAYYERFFGTRIMRLPHPSVYRMLAENVFQPPPNWPVTQAAGMVSLEFDEVWAEIYKEIEAGPEVLAGVGVRAADSVARRLSTITHGAVNLRTRQFFPIWDWNKARLVEEFEASGVKLPYEYTLFGRSFDGIDFRFLASIKEHFPRDYDRILEFFPLAELELLRMQWRAEHHNHT